VNISRGPHAVDHMIEQNEAAIDRLLASAAALADDQMREPSLLPGWTRGHVLTHVARSGDGLLNLLSWAETGEQTPQYPSVEARAADIEAGAGRPADEITSDVADSAGSFISRARALPEDAWLTEVRAIRGPAHPAWFVLNRRLFEIEVHHADLGVNAGLRGDDPPHPPRLRPFRYGPVNWPDWFVSDELYRVTGEYGQNPDCPPVVLNDSASGRQYFLRAGADVASSTTVTSSGYALLAWLIGRESDADLSVDPDGPLPDIPSYG
jgi:maleylpyruvate isomerase